MKLSTIISIILALLAALVLALLVFAKEGGCDRDVPDEDPRPACKPGDETCKAGKPAPPGTPPIGGAK